MKLPSAAHPITISSAGGAVTVRIAGKIIAESNQALLMHEGGHDPVYYIPRSDTDMARLKPTKHTTHCAYKGDASYFSLKTADGEIENAVWSYEAPYPAVAEIANYLAFYSSKVDSIEFTPTRA